MRRTESRSMAGTVSSRPASNRRIKVLHILRSLAVGGAEQVVVNYALFGNEKRFEIAVCTLCGGGPLQGPLDEAGVRVHSLNKQPGFDPWIIPALVRVIRRESPDVVHTHNFTANTWGRIAARIARVPAIVATEHNVMTGRSRLRRLLRRWLARSTDRVIGVSQSVVSSHQQEDGISSDRYLTIYNGADPERFNVGGSGEELMDQPPFDEPGLVVGIVGSLTPQKGHRDFLEAALLVSNSIPTARFVVVGEGDLRPDLEELTGRLELSQQVTFMGLRADIPHLLKQFDLFVLSSLWEGTPMTILEAMASGLPIVATRVGGLAEIVVSGETGILVEPGDPKALADAMIDLLRDEPRRHQFGRAGRQRFEAQFTVASMVAQTEALYESLVR